MAKRITAIVSLAIIGILIIATIILANVSVNYSIRCASPSSVWISYSSSVERDATKDVDSIESLISKASKEKALTALFNGTLNKKAEVVHASSVGKTMPSNSGFNIRFRYENAQKLKVGKKDFKDANGNYVYFEDLVFEVKNLEGTTQYNVYVIPESESPKTYTYYYELEANFEELYSFLVDNEYNV